MIVVTIIHQDNIYKMFIRKARRFLCAYIFSFYNSIWIMWQEIRAEIYQLCWHQYIFNSWYKCNLMHDLNLKIVIWYSFSLCVSFRICDQFSECLRNDHTWFEIYFRFDWLYILRHWQWQSNLPMFLPILLASTLCKYPNNLPSIFSTRNLKYLLTWCWILLTSVDWNGPVTKSWQFP